MEWDGWESGDTVHVADVTWPKGHVEFDELIRRLVMNFRSVTFDWIGGSLWAQWRYAKWVGLNGPPVVLQAERDLIGTTVLVSISDEPKLGCVRFFLTPDTGSIDLNFGLVADIEDGRALSRKLAMTLGYTFSTVEVTDATTESGGI